MLLLTWYSPHSYHVLICKCWEFNIQPADALVTAVARASASKTYMWFACWFTTWSTIFLFSATAPSHYPNHCWLIIQKILSLEGNFIDIVQNINVRNDFENDISKPFPHLPGVNELIKFLGRATQHDEINNRPISQIPQYTCPISHNAPFRTEMCIFLFWMVHCRILHRCIVGFVNLVYCYVNMPNKYVWELIHHAATCMCNNQH